MKIWLSCASAQFKDCRNAIGSDLRARDFDVDYQEEFTLHPGTLLQKLEDRVASSDRIIISFEDAAGKIISGIFTRSSIAKRTFLRSRRQTHRLGAEK